MAGKGIKFLGSVMRGKTHENLIMTSRLVNGNLDDLFL